MKNLIIKNLLPAPWAWLGLILFFVLGLANAQTHDDSKWQPNKYVANLVLTNGAVARGLINLVGDSSIHLADGHSFHFSSLQSNKMRKPKVALKGAAVGAAAGLIIGLLAAKHEDFSCGPNVLICGQFINEVDQALTNRIIE